MIDSARSIIPNPIGYINTSGITIDQVPVTGWSMDDVVHLLGIDEDLQKKMKQPGATTLSLGEGMSGFVPGLRKIGVNAYGVDIWYDKPEFTRDAPPSDLIRTNQEASKEFLQM